MDIKFLEEIGFTGSEARVYIALLELGNTTSGPLIIKSNVVRSKIYDVLSKLKEKGLASESVKRNRKYFQAISPEKILDIIKEKEDNLRGKEEEFKKILPELLLKHRLVREKEEAKIYVGFDGIKSLYDEILEQLKENDEYLAFTFSDKSLDKKSVILMFQTFHQKRAEKRIFAKILCNAKDHLTIKKMNYSFTPLYEFRITRQRFPTSIAIFGNNVATFVWGKTPRAFVTACKENAEKYRDFFYYIWDSAKLPK